MKEKIPLRVSMGGDNAYYFWCELHEGQRAYGVCLSLMKAYKDGNLVADSADIYDSCAAAFKRSKCPAMKMRKEEVTAGHALFFKQRIKRGASFSEAGESKAVDKSSESYKRGWNQVDATRKSTIPLNIKQKADQIEIGEFNHAKIVTEMAKEETA